MIDFIIQYWVEVLFGAITTGAIFIAKRYMNLAKQAKEQGKKDYYDKLFKDINAINKEIIDKVTKESREEDIRLQKQIDLMNEDVSTLKAGVLSLQSREFKSDCHKLLTDDYDITLEDWEDLQLEHEIYNSLGGNHKGDELYELVKEKMKKNLK